MVKALLYVEQSPTSDWTESLLPAQTVLNLSRVQN